MGDKEAKLRGQVINKPKEQMWMLKSESVSSILVKGGVSIFSWNIIARIKYNQQSIQHALRIWKNTSTLASLGIWNGHPSTATSPCKALRQVEEYKYTNTQKKYAKAQIHKKIRKYTNTLEEYKYTSELGHMQRTPSSVGICCSKTKSGLI